jgi:hypothetical protein
LRQVTGQPTEPTDRPPKLDKFVNGTITERGWFG